MVKQDRDLGLIRCKPSCIHHIIIRNALYLSLLKFGINILYFFCRNSCIYATWFNNCFFEQHRACGNDGVAAYHAMVHHDGSHADEYIVVQCTSVNNRPVSDGNIIADIR